MNISTPSTDTARFRIFFGGPDCRPRILSDLLNARVSAVPPGGEVAWATYYFRDEALAEALVNAKKRGVRVCVTVEAKPRTARANSPVLDMLRDEARLAGDCRALRHSWPESLLSRKPPRLHLKLYYFSHPEPHVLVGTFNPSGNMPEDPSVVAEIGDQDRGHNYLVEITDPQLVAGLRDHARSLHQSLHGPWERLLPRNNRVLAAGDSRVYLFPRLRRDVIRQKLRTLPTGTTLRMAVSHFNDTSIGKTLLQLSKRGVDIHILSHDTERRVPRRIETLLAGHVVFRRYRHPQGFPMHNKFILIDSGRQREAIFGSMNLSGSSLHANHELLVISADPLLFDAFQGRWEHMIRETQAMPT
jgi:phosphatidylserine/phosphatidylglycerophosphate/cardiolipin synthase-like enzyme